MKRYIYIIIGIVVIAVIAVLAIVFLKGGGDGTSLFGLGSLPSVGTQGLNGGGNGANATGTAGGAGNSGTGTANPIVLGQGNPAQTFGMVTDGTATGSVLDYFVNASNTVYAIRTDGEIISIMGGNVTVLSTTTVADIINAGFSYDGKKALISFGDPSNPQAEIFDIASKKWVAAPTGMQSPQWSPYNYQIAYLTTTQGGTTYLALLNALNVKVAPSTVTSLPAADLTLQWPAKSQFILSDKPTLNDLGSVWMFNAAAGTLTPVAYELAGAESAWGPTASGTMGLLFGIRGVGSETFQLLNAAGAATQSLSFLTLPSKCAFASVTSTITASTTSKTVSTPYLFCGVPSDKNAFASAQLPDAYNMMSLFTSDNVIQVDLSNGAENVIRADIAPHMDATDLKVANGTLFFINRYDEQLYALTLPKG